MCDEFDVFLRIKFPLFKRTAIVLFLVMLAWLDQKTEPVDPIKMTRLPSQEIVSSSELGFFNGSSLFATHAGVNLEILLNHMPRYHLLVF